MNLSSSQALSSSAFGSISVSGPAAVVTALPLKVVAGVPFTGTIGTFYQIHPDPVNVADYSAALATTTGTTQPTTSLSIVSLGNGLFQVNGTVTFSTIGTYNDKLVITHIPDNTSFSGSSTATVLPAQFSASGVSLNPTVGVPLNSVVVATFTDNTPGATAAGYTASINWGNGLASTQGTIIPDPSGTSGLFDVEASFTYATAGLNLATVTITRLADKTTVTASTSVNVSPAVFSASGVSVSAVVGVPISNVKVATFTDNTTPNAVAADYTATILWGNGLAATQGNITGSAGNFTVTGNYIYAAPGLNVATVTITRLTDSKTALASSTVLVSPTALVASAVPPLGTIAGLPLNRTVATFTDNTGDPIGDYTATIAWGTGLPTTQGTIVPDPGGKGVLDVQGAFTYPSTGAFVATTTISRTFPTSQSATASTSVTVSPAKLVATGTTIHATAGSVFTLPVATFTDNTPKTVPGDYTATINWGDGKAATQGVITANPTTPGSFVVTGSYNYAAAGNRHCDRDHHSTVIFTNGHRHDDRAGRWPSERGSHASTDSNDRLSIQRRTRHGRGRSGW